MPTYLIPCLIKLPFFLVLFYLRKDLRIKMLYLGFLTGLASLTDPWFTPSYYRPIYLEKIPFLDVDFLVVAFMFMFAGIAAVIYEELMKRKGRKLKRHTHLKYLIFTGPIIFVGLHFLTVINTILILLFATTVMLLIVFILRRDLIMDGIYSGIFMATLWGISIFIFVFLVPDAINTWNYFSFPQNLIINIPSFEIIWGLLTGAFLGTFYEFSHEQVIVRARRR